MSVTENTEPSINITAATEETAAPVRDTSDYEAHQRRLEKRREYYRLNREHIRQRDNESARRNREKDPERYRLYLEQYRARVKAKAIPPPPPPDTLDNNPDRERILDRIAMEKEGICNE